MSQRSPLRVGIGGPVGSGKTALTLNLCQALREKYNMAVVTNDIYTKEDSNFLTRNEAMSPERIVGVETGGCPHTAIREDASINLAAIDDLCEKFDGLELIIIESGGDNLAATFSPELSDLTLYVIDVAGGEKIPRKGGPGITKSDLMIINKSGLTIRIGLNTLRTMGRNTQGVSLIKLKDDDAIAAVSKIDHEEEEEIEAIENVEDTSTTSEPENNNEETDNNIEEQKNED